MTVGEVTIGEGTVGEGTVGEGTMPKEQWRRNSWRRNSGEGTVAKEQCRRNSWRRNSWRRNSWRRNGGEGTVAKEQLAKEQLAKEQLAKEQGVICLWQTTENRFEFRARTTKSVVVPFLLVLFAGDTPPPPPAPPPRRRGRAGLSTSSLSLPRGTAISPNLRALYRDTQTGTRQKFTTANDLGNTARSRSSTKREFLTWRTGICLCSERDSLSTTEWSIVFFIGYAYEGRSLWDISRSEFANRHKKAAYFMHPAFYVIIKSKMLR